MIINGYVDSLLAVILVGVVPEALLVSALALDLLLWALRRMDQLYALVVVLLCTGSSQPLVLYRVLV
jgi:hypothetical protein